MLSILQFISYSWPEPPGEVQLQGFLCKHRTQHPQSAETEAPGSPVMKWLIIFLSDTTKLKTALLMYVLWCSLL